MEESAESVVAAHVGLFGRRAGRDRWLLLERAVGSVRVLVGHVFVGPAKVERRGGRTCNESAS